MVRRREAAGRLRRSQRTGLLFALLAFAAAIACLVGFACGLPGLGTAAGITALIASSVGMAWLGQEDRRSRQHHRFAPRVGVKF